MARISKRQLFRFRQSIFSPPDQASAANTKSLPFPSISSSSCFSEERTISLLNACQNVKQLFQIHAHLITSGIFVRNSFWSTRVLKHSSDYGNVDYSISVLKCIGNPGTFCVNAVIKAYSNSCVPDKAVIFYFQMVKNSFVPNSYTFVPLFGSCAKMGRVERGKMCHGLAVKNGVDSVLPVQNSLIYMYGYLGVMESAKKVFVEMSRKDLISWNSIIDGFVRSGDLWVAHELFDIMPVRNVISWNIMISGYLKNDNPGCSLKLFRTMTKNGFKGSDRTMVSVLTACGRSARLNEGRSVHGYITRSSGSPNIVLHTSLIDMYSKCQKVEVARRVFDRMAVRNLVCWNAMILGYCIHGNPEAGLKLFSALVHQKEAGGVISPDEITFVGVLCACVRAELFAEGRNYFSQMIHLHKVMPNFAHYWCMANLYAIAGRMEEAEEFLRKMSEDSDDLSFESIMWINLLSLCRFQGEIASVEKVAESFIEMNPQDFLRYQFLINVHAVAGRWEDVSRVKKLIKKRTGRMPGCRLVDLKEIVHELKVGLFQRDGNEKYFNTFNKCGQRSSLVTSVSNSKPATMLKKESGS